MGGPRLPPLATRLNYLGSPDPSLHLARLTSLTCWARWRHPSPYLLASHLIPRPMRTARCFTRPPCPLLMEMIQVPNRAGARSLR